MTTDDADQIATPRVAAGAMFLDAAGRVLLVKPTYKRGWDIPGGYVTPGEAPLAACRRELAEELGRTWSVHSQPLVVDWAPARNEGDKILFVFDGGTLPDDALESATFADGADLMVCAKGNQPDLVRPDQGPALGAGAGRGPPQ